jgi:predicted acylesterase/phospholipase RssA
MTSSNSEQEIIPPQRTTFFESCRGVFQGGGCRAAALAGAIYAANRCGVNFTAVAGTSAGSIVAALIGAGAEPSFIMKNVKDLDFRRLLRPPITQDATDRRIPGVVQTMLAATCIATLSSAGKVLRWGGMYSSVEIEKWIERLLKQLLPNVVGPVHFEHLVIPTYIVATDLASNKAKIWSTAESKSEGVAFAVRASCSIPFFFQPVASGANRYVDGGVLSNLPSFVFSDSDATELNSDPILAFLLQEQEQSITSWSVPELLKRLIGAAIDGSTDLQLRMHPTVNTISIPTGDIKATDFERVRREEKEKLISAGEKATLEFFRTERARFISRRQNVVPIRDQYELLHAVVLELSTSPTEVIVRSRDSKWVWKLYPSILNALATGIVIRVALPSGSSGATADEIARRRLLANMGIQIVEREDVGSEEFVFIHTDSTRNSAIVMIQSGDELPDIGTHYIGRPHLPVIEQIRRNLEGVFEKAGGKVETNCPELCGCTATEFERRLRRGVHQYHSAKIELHEVKLALIDPSVRFIRSYKYRQIHHLVRLFKERGLGLFEPVEVHYGPGRTSLMTPPVLERNGVRYFVIEGNTRIFYCGRFGIEQVHALVISDVSAQLPAEAIPLRHVRLTSSYVEPKIRFRGLQHPLFRHVESAIQQPV